MIWHIFIDLLIVLGALSLTILGCLLWWMVADEMASRRNRRRKADIFNDYKMWVDR